MAAYPTYAAAYPTYAEPLSSRRGPGTYGTYDIDTKESLTWTGSDHFDLRIRESLHSEKTWLGSVSLREVLGASIVTYDEHIDFSNNLEPISPKAVYVQYTSPDPVTGSFTPVVAPAQLSLDVYVDPSMFALPQEEEEEIEEEEEKDAEEEDRRKLRSSIWGDPILMRAKPAPPPDPYFASVRHETLLHAAESAKHKQEAQKGMFKRKGYSATMSSFMKASGKDKYSRPRIGEIDSILNAKQYKVEPSADASRWGSPDSAALAQPVRIDEDSAAGSLAGSQSADRNLPVSAGSAAGPGVCQPTRSPRGDGGLAAQMAVHIQRMPTFHRGGHMVQLDGIANCVEKETSEAGDGAFGQGDEDGDGHRSPLGDTSSHAASPGEAASAAEASMSIASGNRRSRMDSKTRAGGFRAGGKMVIRDLDPHLDLSESAPTQRMHSNWPDGMRRQLARHFYGMSPASIFEEEEKERLREQQLSRARTKSVAAKSELGAKDSSESDGSPNASTMQAAVAAAGATADSVQLSAMQRAQKQAIERSLQRSTQVVAHRLEVRIKNTERPHRVVVTQHTPRLRGKEEANCRPTMLLGKLEAERKELAKKY